MTPSNFDTVSGPVRREIEKRLQQIEAEERVIVLYACESGSRAWGFASQNSDYDVRFLYAHPRDWYLSIDLEHKRDVIERPVSADLDLSGWDLRKALPLLQKSNPPLLEWLRSPIIYREQNEIMEKFRELVTVCYSPRASMYHYLHMAQGNYRNYLKGDEVWLKKYFYVLRPLLAVKWIEAGLGPVPMEFEKLVDRLIENPELKLEIDKLLAAKRRGKELDRGPRNEPISRFIELELERLEQTSVNQPATKPDIKRLNAFFRETLERL